MKDKTKLNSYYDLKEANVKKRNAVNNRRKSMIRGIQGLMTGDIEVRKDSS